MSSRERTKESKLLFRELPYFGENITKCHGRFNNLLAQQSGLSLPSKKYLDRLPSLNDIDLFTLYNSNPDALKIISLIQYAAIIIHLIAFSN